MFKVAIPSYFRSDVIASKTLAVLGLGGVPVSDIFIFVVPEEEAAYKKACSGYNVITGVKGLVEQRKFIQRYFPLNTNIVMMDDDVDDIFKASYKNEKHVKEVIPDLSDLFTSMFQRMAKENVSLCGICAHTNLKFALAGAEVSTNLKYVVGALYLIKNLRMPEVQPGQDILEDTERTVLYYKKERKILRFNHICIKTKYFGKGGLETPDRLMMHSGASQELVQRYPDYLRLKVSKNLIDAKIRTGKALTAQQPSE
jgi:hypothetical protein